MTESIRPRNDYLLIRRMKSDMEEKSELHIPDNAQDFEEAYKGKVIKVGPGRKSPEGFRYDIPLEKGDIVLYKQYSGHSVENVSGDSKDDENLWLVNEKDVLAKLPEEKK